MNDDLPEARLVPRRRGPWFWLLPLLALAAAGGLVWQSLGQRGLPLEVQFRHGHGLKPGDALRYRGIQVGRVRGVSLAEGLDGIRVTAELDPTARELAREGSQFWIARPQFGLDAITGLDTVVGANYLGVLPGEGQPRRDFTGLEEPPLQELQEPGGLEIVLTAPGKGRLRPGAPVSYREVVIGALVAVDLARDAASVEARAYIRPRYRPLIREGLRFWKTGGAKVEAGLGGFSVAVDSVQGLLRGGVTLAIPPNPGHLVEPGHRFPLAEQPDPDWLAWSPNLSLVAAAPATRPEPLAASLVWEYKNFAYLTREGRREGRVLPVTGGFLGPRDLFDAPDDALPGSVRSQVGQLPLVPLPNSRPRAPGLAWLPVRHGYSPWTLARWIDAPEDSLVIAGSGQPNRFLGADAFQAGEGLWLVRVAAPFDAPWHGAAVVSERDGALLGLLLVTEDGPRLARVPETLEVDPEEF